MARLPNNSLLQTPHALGGGPRCTTPTRLPIESAQQKLNVGPLVVFLTKLLFKHLWVGG
jgi:hypothetical protein